MFKVWDFQRWLTIIFAIFLTTNVALAAGYEMGFVSPLGSEVPVV